MPVGCRAWFERCAPGGWWRRDLLLHILDETYPAWLTASEIADIARVIHPKWNFRPRHEIHASKSLGRLHGLGLADRIGQRGGFAGRVKGTDWKGGWRKSAGYRYRLVRRVDSLL